MSSLFFSNDTATTEIYTLSLHDALPIFGGDVVAGVVGLLEAGEDGVLVPVLEQLFLAPKIEAAVIVERDHRSEEHTSELQSRLHLVCRLLLEKKNNIEITYRKMLITTVH